MAKGKSPVGNQSKGRVPPPDQREQGLRWYQMGRLDAAITAWQPLAATDPQVAKGLAEVYFRRALAQTAPAADKLTNLRQAVELAPADNRYGYHLGMALHRVGDLQGALQQYRAVLQRDKQWPGAVQLLALATLELDPQADLALAPGMRQEWLTALAPVQALLRGKPPTTQGDEPDQQLWRGLGLLLQNDAKAGKVLDDNRPFPSANAISIRRYYRGVAAAQSGDLQAAIHTWQNVGIERFTQPWLRTNLAAALQQRLETHLTADDLTSAADSALLGVPFATGNVGLAELLVQTLDRGAHVAAEAGDWSRAASLWAGARQVISNSTGLGSPRPILHNLALAFEGADQWLEAAETWRAMLRTRPRKTGGGTEQSAGLSDAQWSWVRRRVIECYKRADAPGEAVTVFRQAIKSEPNDLDLRFQLSEALLANDQEQAALNELQRILDIDPKHVDAKLRTAEIRSERGEWWDSERILRQLVADYPDRQDVRKQLAQQLLSRGARDMVWSMDEATKLIEEGQSLAPDDFRFPLNLARIAIALKQRDRATTLLNRTLELGTDQPQVYVLVIESWALADDLGEARAVLDRAEHELTITPEFYVDLGRALMVRSRPAPVYTNPFLPPPPPPKAVDNEVSRFATEVFERAIAQKPDDPRLRGQIAAALMTIRPDIALQYAAAGAQLAPDQPSAVMLFGLAQALNEQKKQAKATLKRAIQLAKAQNQPDIAAQAEAMLQQVGSPFLRMSLEMAEMGLDEFDDLDDFDDDDLWP